MALVKVTTVSGVILMAAAVIFAGPGLWRSPSPQPSHSGSDQGGEGASVATSASGSNDVIVAQLAEHGRVLEQIIERLTVLESLVRSSDRPNEHERATSLSNADMPIAGGQPLSAQEIQEQLRVREEVAQDEGRRRIAAIDQSWMTEPVDRRWSGAYEEQVRAAFLASEWDSASWLDVNCRSSVCKMEFVGDASIDIDGVNAAMIALEPFQDTEFTITTPEDSAPGQIVVYVARPGSKHLSRFIDEPN